MSEYIDFESEIPWDKMEILLELGDEFFFDPSSSTESENYFIELLSKYQNCDDLATALREEIKKDFKVLDKNPDWLQVPEWQFNDGRPMEFVGQIEIKQDKIGLHDDAVFYIFWDRETGIIKTIMQLA